MDLFIANVTEQNHTFHWRELENPKIMSQDIPAGQQIKLLSDKSPEVIQSVIDHHKIYGLVDVAGAKKARQLKQKIVLVYSTKGPLGADVYELAQESNDVTAAEQVQLAKEKAAYTFGKMIEQDMTGLKENIQEVELEISEDAPREQSLKDKPLVRQKFNTKIKK